MPGFAILTGIIFLVAAIKKLEADQMSVTKLVKEGSDLKKIDPTLVKLKADLLDTATTLFWVSLALVIITVIFLAIAQAWHRNKESEK